MEAAIFDLLTSQCDRHANNIFISDSGSVTLIDNGDALGRRGVCSPGVLLNSLLLPSTPEHTYKIIGRPCAESNSLALMMQPPLPHARMDYRCHAGGEIGYNYSEGVANCLKHYSSASNKQIREELDLLDLTMVHILRRRAVDMLERGFEWTLYNGFPQNSKRNKFTPQPQCCHLNPVSAPDKPWWVPFMFECEDGWVPELILH